MFSIEAVERILRPDDIVARGAFGFAMVSLGDRLGHLLVQRHRIAEHTRGGRRHGDLLAHDVADQGSGIDEQPVSRSAKDGQMELDIRVLRTLLTMPLSGAAAVRLG